ncbi:MAG: hypothetical protein IPN72_09940 [Saprospiraceae bacterium]|nr:hypothetical protein [Saprospiraceae bacterium]
MYTEMDSFALAASYFTKALAIEKSRPEAHYGLGLVEYLKTRDNLSYMVYFGLEDAGTTFEKH